MNEVMDAMTYLPPGDRLVMADAFMELAENEADADWQRLYLSWGRACADSVI